MNELENDLTGDTTTIEVDFALFFSLFIVDVKYLQ